ncbi:MAG TPA: AMP-binding protein [Candidatus Brocadiia bacterium]|nr:AMP-binding protein [Candidatus Brocadiia bacterium]
MKTLRDVWRNTVEKFPVKTAFICDDASVTFREADKITDRLRSAMAAEFGLRPGDRVSVAMPNCLEYCLIYWAVVKAGAVVVPVNIRLRAEEMRHVIENADASILFLHASVWGNVIGHARQSSCVKHIVAVGGSPEGDAVSYEQLAGHEITPCAEPEADPEGLVIIMHTSGTTGRPKGAMMRHCDIFFNVRNAIIAQSFRHEDVHLLVVPMFHCTALYSMLPSGAYLGSTIVVAPKADMRYLVELIQKHRITTFMGVPTMFYFLTTLEGLETYDLSSVRLIAYAGSVMPTRTIQMLRERFPRASLHNFFGLTETISMTHVLPSADALLHPDSVGKPLPEIHTRIIGDDGLDLPKGRVGELCFHRDNIIPGYWKQDGLLEKSMTPDGWFRTGDLACSDEEGFLYIKGRSKEMIIVGGENVYALEVENVIMQHPGVLEAAVVGIPATGVRAYLGELVKAVVVPRPGHELGELDIKKHCAGHLANYKIPHFVEFRDALPRNASGKVLKRDLQ